MDVGSFEILAEVAIGIAGFGSIAIVLSRDRNSWESADLFRTASLFALSLGALFLALLPIGLAAAQITTEWIWRTSSAVMLFYQVAVLVVMIPSRRRYLDRRLWFGPIATSLFVTSAVANLLAQTFNVAGALFEPSLACYFFGVVYFLMGGCVMLVRIVFVRPQSR